MSRESTTPLDDGSRALGRARLAVSRGIIGFFLLALFSSGQHWGALTVAASIGMAVLGAGWIVSVSLRVPNTAEFRRSCAQTLPEAAGFLALSLGAAIAWLVFSSSPVTRATSAAVSLLGGYFAASGYVRRRGEREG